VVFRPYNGVYDIPKHFFNGGLEQISDGKYDPWERFRIIISANGSFNTRISQNRE